MSLSGRQWRCVVSAEVTGEKWSVIKHDMMIKCHHKIKKKTSERRSIIEYMSNHETNNLQNYN